MSGQVSLRLYRDCIYVPFLSDSHDLFILGVYLSTDLSSTCERLKDSSFLLLGGNLTVFERNGEYIRMRLNYEKEEYVDDPDAYSLRIPIVQLIKISEEWSKIIKDEPAFIIITENNDEYSIVASDKPHKVGIPFDQDQPWIKMVMGLSDNNLYNLVFKRENRFELLGKFLIEDTLEQSTFEQWIKNSNSKMISNNGIVLEKQDNNVLLYLSCNSDTYKSDLEKYYLTIPVDQFIYILGKWHRLLPRKKRFIFLEERNNEYRLIASRRNPKAEIYDEDLEPEEGDDILWM